MYTKEQIESFRYEYKHGEISVKQFNAILRLQDEMILNHDDIMIEHDKL